MINRSIARRYARALFDLEKADPRDTAKRLASFAALIAGNPTLREVLQSPAFSLEERKRVLGRILAEQPVPLPRFLSLLVERKRIGSLAAIVEEYEKLVDEREGRARVLVEVAVPLEATAIDRLKALLQNSLDKEIVLEQKVEPELIAGVAIRIGGLKIDGSFRSQLNRMRERLKRARA